MSAKLSIKSLLNKNILLVLPLLFSASAFAETCPVVSPAQISNGNYNVAPYSGYVSVPGGQPNLRMIGVTRTAVRAAVTPEKTQLTSCFYDVTYLGQTGTVYAGMILYRSPNSPMTFGDSADWVASGPTDFGCYMTNTSGSKCSFNIGDSAPTQKVTTNPFGAVQTQ